MLYDVEQISELTKISKVTIYKKFKLNELQQYIVKKQGKAYVDEEGFNLIKQNLNLTDKLNEKSNSEDIESDENSYIATDNEDLINVKNDLINSLNEQVEFLKEQLSIKDIQIQELNERLKQEQDLNKNNQILQLRQPNDIKSLEEHFEVLDNKLADIKTEMEQRKIKFEADQQEKGFFKFLKRSSK